MANHWQRPGCVKCGSTDLEHWGDGEYSIYCYRCNDREIEFSNRAREWREFHDEPMPKAERDGE